MEFPPRELVVDPWLPAKGLAMITGKAGIGKTLIGLQLAWGIATGQSPIQGWTAPTPRRVLYIEGEMSRMDLQARLRAIKGGMPICPARGFFRKEIADLFVDTRGGIPDLSTPGGQGWLDRRLGDSEVIIIDSITTLMPTQDQLDGHEWASVQVWMLEQRRRGRSVILVHHNNKAGSQNGTERRMIPLTPRSI
jgi:putative DNA primase/helicase